MASPIITPLPVQTETNYRPVSRLAVIGILLAALSPIIFMSENLFWFLLAVILPAFVICMIALRAIRSSEGNLAGEPIALLGIVLSVGSGLGWLTMTTVTKYVTESEAKAAVEDWIGKLQRNEPGAAFLLTVDPKYRKVEFNPEEHGKLRKMFPGEQQTNMFDRFLVDPISGQFLRYGEKAKATYAGLVETQTTRESPVFRFKYEMNTPIADGSCIVSARAQDIMTDEGVRRDWKMSIEGNASYFKFTPYGEQLKVISDRARDVLERFVLAVANDEMALATGMFDPKEPGELQTVLGYIRPKGRTGPIFPISLLKPIRLRTDSMTNGLWVMTFDCTITVENDRGVDFAVTVHCNDPEMKKMTLRNCRFLGMQKVLAPTSESEGKLKGIPKSPNQQ